MIVELARGGMGDVFLAVSRGPGGFHKLVVIKELRATLSTENEFLTMFMAEARLSARLHHPNIVQTNEVGQEGNRYFMAMEYLEGQTLSKCVKLPRDELTPAMQLRILVDVLNGLHYAHELTDYDGAPLNIVHRDVSPHNVMITYDGQAKILDFGIAKTRDSVQQTATGVLKGKVPYMAPEQLDRHQDRRADVFAVGVMAWEAIAGRRMWEGKGDLGIVQMLAEGKIPSLREAKSDVSAELDRIVSRALAPDPANRYATAQEFSSELESHLDAAALRATPKQIGKLVTQAFAKEREQIRALIDDQLRLVASTDSDTIEVVKALPHVAIAQAGDMTPSGESVNRSARDGRTPSAAVVGSREGVSGISAHGEPRRSKKVMAAVAGAGLVLAVGVVVVGLRGKRSSAPAGEAAPSASYATEGASAASSVAPAIPSVELFVSVSPPDARLFVDDTLVDGNPYKALLAKGSAHRVRAEAPGYVPASESRVVEEDSMISLVLEPLKPEAGARSRTPVGVRSPGRAPPRAPSTAATPPANTHTIDPSDPYAK
jgi:hypothetical protein